MSLELRSVTKSFGENTLFRDFSYVFPNTGSYVLKGDSGTGKTTFLRMISGIDNDYSGEIIGGGIENTSICFQEYRLFPLISAFANVLKVAFPTANEENSQKTFALLSKLGFTEENMKLKPSKLSGGMKQRVSLVRAFLRDAPILLLDEPTKEIDEKIRNTLYDIIKEESERRLVILVSHHQEDFQKLNAEKIYI